MTSLTLSNRRKAFGKTEVIRGINLEIADGEFVHMRAEIAALHRRLANTMLYVTHDQIEAMALADRIVVLRDGRIEQVGTPRQLYANPANIFVAQFIGSPKMNVLPTADLAGALDAAGVAPDGAERVGIRPEHLRLVHEGDGVLSGRVAVSEYTGSGSLLHVDCQVQGRSSSSTTGRTARRRKRRLALVPSLGCPSVPSGGAGRGRRGSAELQGRDGAIGQRRGAAQRDTCAPSRTPAESRSPRGHGEGGRSVGHSR